MRIKKILEKDSEEITSKSIYQFNGEPDNDNWIGYLNSEYNADVRNENVEWGEN